MSKNKMKQTQTRVEKSSWRRVKIRMLHSPTSHHPLAMPMPMWVLANCHSNLLRTGISSRGEKTYPVMQMKMYTILLRPWKNTLSQSHLM